MPTTKPLHANFDEIIDRRGTGSIKWDDPFNETGKPDVIPLWVADMDFAAPEPVLRAIRDRAEHPVFGYTRESPDYAAAVADWYKSRYGCTIGEDSVLLAPGMIPSLIISVRSLTSVGAGVVVFTPVYYPFYDIIRDNGRVLVSVPFAQDADLRFQLDFNALDRAIAEAAAKGVKTEAIMFCSPHNPGGRVWSPEELDSLLSYAKMRNLAFICDEIHADIDVGGAIPGESIKTPRVRFTSVADRSLAVPGDQSPCPGPDIVVLGAPNKTFNLAGLHLSHFAVTRDDTRAKIRRGIAAAGFSQPNVFSLTAAHTAYRECGPWLDELNAYLRSNIDYLIEFLSARLPELKAVRPDGGYLVWLNARPLIARLGFSNDHDFVQALAKEGRVRFNFGSKFGSGGEGYLRMNVACPRSQLAEGLERFAVWATAKAEK